MVTVPTFVLLLADSDVAFELVILDETGTDRTANSEVWARH